MDLNTARGLTRDRRGFELTGSGTVTSSGSPISAVAGVLSNLGADEADRLVLAPLYVNSTSTNDDGNDVGVKEKLVEVYAIGAAAATAYTNTFTITETPGAGDHITLGTNFGSSAAEIEFLGTETVEEVAAAVAAGSTLVGYSITSDGADILVVADATGNSLENVGISKSGTVDYTNVEVIGTFAGGSKKEISVFGFDLTGLASGDITMYLNSATGIPVAILDTDGEADIVAKLIAACPETHDYLDFGTNIVFTNKTPGENAIPMSIDGETTNLVATIIMHQDGVDASGGELVPGDIEVNFGTEDPETITLEEGDTVEDIYARISDAAPDSVTVTIDSGITIENKTSGVLGVHFSVNLGDTGVTKTSSTLTEGTEDGSTGAQTVKLYCVGAADGESAWKTETVVIDGTTQVATTDDYYFCYHAEVLTTGSDKKNAGIIYVGTEGTESNIPIKVHTAINTGSCRSEDHFLFVPPNKKGFITKLIVNNPSSTEYMKLSLIARGNGLITYIIKDFNILPGKNELSFDNPVLISASSYFYPLMKSTSASAPVSFELSAIVIDN